jgi:hypothetical protein
MDNFFVRTFLKNPPIGLIVLGFVVALLGLGNTGMIISWTLIIVGIVWIVMRKRRERKAVAAHLPLYLEIVDTLKKSGYEIDEFEHKSDRVRSTVRLNGNHLGEIFLVAPGGRYAQFRRIEDMTEKEFQYAYSKKFGKSSGISASYWPDNSPIGARIQESAENCSEKGEWLSNVANIFKEKLSDK